MKRQMVFNLKEFKVLGIRCKNCGMSILLSIEANQYSPHACQGCGAELAEQNAIHQFREAFKRLASSAHEITFVVDDEERTSR